MELVRYCFYWNTDGEGVQQLLAVEPDSAGELAVVMHSTCGGILYGSCTKPEHLQPVTAEQMAAIGRDLQGNLLPPTPKVREWWWRSYYKGQGLSLLLGGLDEKGHILIADAGDTCERQCTPASFTRKATPEEAEAAQALYDLTRKAWGQEGEG